MLVLIGLLSCAVLSLCTLIVGPGSFVTLRVEILGLINVLAAVGDLLRGLSILAKPLPVADDRVLIKVTGEVGAVRVELPQVPMFHRLLAVEVPGVLPDDAVLLDAAHHAVLMTSTVHGATEPSSAFGPLAVFDVTSTFKAFRDGPGGILFKQSHAHFLLLVDRSSTVEIKLYFISQHRIDLLLGRKVWITVSSLTLHLQAAGSHCI